MYTYMIETRGRSLSARGGGRAFSKAPLIYCTTRPCRRMGCNISILQAQHGNTLTAVENSCWGAHLLLYVHMHPGSTYYLHQWGSLSSAGLIHSSSNARHVVQ